MDQAADTVDVVVVGAGIAGLVTARRLVDRGATVTITEARDRVGGRTYSRPVGSAMLDLGGQWVGPQQTAVRALADELGLALFPTHHRGLKILSLGGKQATYKGDIPSLSLLNLAELQLAIRKLNRLSRQVNPAEPYAAKDAMKLDSMTVDSWVRGQVRSRRVRAMVGLLVGSILSAHPGEVSMLYLLHYVAAAGGLEPLIQIEGGAQQDRFVDGAQSLSLRLADGLEERLLLQAPVSHVFQDDEGVTVHTERGDLGCRYTVITAPPAVAGRIQYEPPMPTRRDQLTQRMPMGRTIKCLITYERPFWREAGYSGEALCPDGPVAFVYDNSSNDGAVPGLVAFVTGDDVRRWGDEKPDARRRMVLDTLIGYFGRDAASPTGYIEHDWNSEPWSGGGPVGIATPGALTATTDALWAPVGRIHWAGTETSDVWCGFMEGAVRSGDRAAAEVAARLNL